MVWKLPPGVPDSARRLKVGRGLVEQLLEAGLFGLQQLSHKERITFSMLPEHLVLYVDEKAETPVSKEGGVLLRSNETRKVKADRSQLRS